jgi:hypothetical protein
MEAGADRRILRALQRLARERPPLELRLTGQCMAPLLEDGARLEVSARDRYWPGDVIVLRARDGRLMAHRVLGYLPRAGGLHVVTHGDSMAGPDHPVPLADVVGRVTGGECAGRVRRVPWLDRARAVRRFLAVGLRRMIRR